MPESPGTLGIGQEAGICAPTTSASGRQLKPEGFWDERKDERRSADARAGIPAKKFEKNGRNVGLSASVIFCPGRAFSGNKWDSAGPLCPTGKKTTAGGRGEVSKIAHPAVAPPKNLSGRRELRRCLRTATPAQKVEHSGGARKQQTGGRFGNDGDGSIHRELGRIPAQPAAEIGSGDG